MFCFYFSAYTARKLVLKTMEEFHTHTCIRFVKRQQQANYVDIRGRGLCSSSVGMVGGKQMVIKNSTSGQGRQKVDKSYALLESFKTHVKSLV